LTDADEPFRRRFFADRDELVAARWWQEGMAAAPIADAEQAGDGLHTRRNVIAIVGGAAFVFGWPAISSRLSCDGNAGPVVTADALELQKRSGWNVGASGSALHYSGAASVDVAGQSTWRQTLDSLVSDMAPAQSALLPFYVPTLFQVVSAADFRDQISPIHTVDMDVAAARGDALAALFKSDAGEVKGDTALLVDVPGPSAVALAADLAARFEPVFLFDNWPHPRGVVPSHEVIAAALYYRPTLLLARGTRSPGAPPAFVIDSRRLTFYGDDSDAFDNRYLARLPSAAALQRLGVRHLLYVTDQPVPHEADDLNDDFVAFRDAGVDVKMVALSDFRRVGDGGSAGVYSYGASPSPHYWFWHSYGWYRAPAAPLSTEPAPAGLSEGAGFRPAPRATIFASRTVGGMAGFGKQKPSGFGRVSYRASSAGGIEVGRSGSLGRARFWAGG
jgi:hypothetical protein